MKERIETPTFGEILKEEFMVPRCVTESALSSITDIPIFRIHALLGNSGVITHEESLRLGRFFGVSDEYFLDIQNDLLSRVEKSRCECGEDSKAVLSSYDKYTTFSFGGKKLTFRTCDGLERYTKILLWDNGYIEVMAKYRQRDEEIEEYIDLNPILDDLYMDKEKFLSQIKGVRIEYPDSEGLLVEEKE